MIVDWIQLPDENWADFTEEGLQPFEEDREKKCVYLIWSVNENRMIYVGSGDVERLWDHLKENEITDYKGVKFTYALIKNKDDYQGAENYLAQVYGPLVGERYPQDNFKEVNLPNIGVDYRSDRVGGTSNDAKAIRSMCNYIKNKKKNC